MLGTIVNMEEPHRVPALCGEDGSLCIEWAKGPWQEMIAAAENAYDRSSRCEFTSFIGYEYTGTTGLANIHRNVIFRNSVVPEVPVTYIEAPRDQLLWEKLNQSCPESDGCSWVTIPHNSNLSNGRMPRRAVYRKAAFGAPPSFDAAVAGEDGVGLLMAACDRPTPVRGFASSDRGPPGTP